MCAMCNQVREHEEHFLLNWFQHNFGVYSFVCCALCVYCYCVYVFLYVFFSFSLFSLCMSVACVLIKHVSVIVTRIEFLNLESCNIVLSNLSLIPSHCNSYQLISPWTEWPPFRWWYFQMHFRERKKCILVKISLKFVRKCPIDNKPALV